MDKTEKAMKKLKIKKPSKDVCDCNKEECPGCFWPCESCSSNKCGHICRVNRGWRYKSWEKQGRNDE